MVVRGNVKTVCAVIVTFNRLALLKNSVRAYLEEGIDHMLILNNASADSTSEYLESLKKQLGSRVSIIHSVENTGGAGGFYQALLYARDNLSYDWFVISDDDSFPANGTIKKFRLSRMSELKSIVLSAAVYFPNGNICPMNRPIAMPSFRNSLSNFLKRYPLVGLGNRAYKQSLVTEILAASFVGMFVSADTLSASKVLPDPDFFIYWDDIDFCLRLRQHSAKILFDPLLTFEHDCNRNSGSVSGTRFYYLVRNGYRVLKKMPLSYKLFGYPLKTLAWAYGSIRSKSVKFFVSALMDVNK